MTHENLSAILDELALRFGETGEALWWALVEYERIHAATGLFGMLMIGFMFLLAGVIAYTNLNADGAFVFALAAVFAVFMFVIGASFLPAFLIPEAAVLKGLLR